MDGFLLTNKLCGFWKWGYV